MEKEIKIWFDKEGDYLEVLFENKEGYFKETDNDAIMKKVDAEGSVIGFSILNVSALDKPLSVTIDSHSEENDPDELNEETKRDIAEARAEIKAGKFHTWDEVKRELGL